VLAVLVRIVARLERLLRPGLRALHAGVHLHANDRQGLEHLCGYGARPPFSQQRLTALPDGRLAWQLKRPLGDGRTALLLQPTELLRRLATLVPPPRAHLVRYHGVFAPAARWRREVIPAPAPEPAPPAVAETPQPIPRLAVTTTSALPASPGQSCCGASSARTSSPARAAAGGWCSPTSRNQRQ
jgi:hypothetical protein